MKWTSWKPLCQPTECLLIQLLPYRKLANLKITLILSTTPTNLNTLVFQTVKLNSQYKIPYSFVESQFILVKYEHKLEMRVSIDQDISSNFIDVLESYSQKQEQNYNSLLKSLPVCQNQNSDVIESKQQKSKERSIQQVLYIVKRWRQIFLNSVQNGRRKINFQQAAEIIGISKKSLDDYYLQLRIGQFHGFNFEDHIDEGIGYLRRFIKQKQKKFNNRVKYPKQLKIFKKYFQSKLNPKSLQQSDEQFKKQLSERQFTATSSNKDRNEHAAVQNPIEQKEDQQDQFRIDQISAFLKQQSIEDLQMQFFGNFRSIVDEPNDPIFSFQKVLYKNPQNQLKLPSQFQDSY